MFRSHLYKAENNDRLVWWKLELERTDLAGCKLPIDRKVSRMIIILSIADNHSLQRFHQYYGDTLSIECPTGSGDVSIPLSAR
jgi:hypothetical protein